MIKPACFSHVDKGCICVVFRLSRFLSQVVIFHIPLHLLVFFSICSYCLQTIVIPRFVCVLGWHFVVRVSFIVLLVFFVSLSLAQILILDFCKRSCAKL